jgi:hypothetical protein
VKPVRPTRHARMLRAAVILILVTLAGGLIAAPAQAAAFRYWGYFHLEKGAWAFAKTGPAGAVPADGSVEGWRFAVADESSTRDPRATPTFDALCAATPVKAATKRVGLVIDYGRPADGASGAQPPAPRATCVAVPVKATGSDVLVAAGVKLRLDAAKGLTCALDGWPATGCGEPVDPVLAAAASPDTTIAIAAASKGNAAASPAAQSTDDGSTSSRGLALGAGAVALIAVLGFVAWRRSREATDG